MEYTKTNILILIKKVLRSRIPTLTATIKGGLFNFIKRNLDLKTRGSNYSQYNKEPIILENGQTLTLRVADHPAIESNFKTDIAISIIIERDNNFTIKYSDSNIYEEIFYSKQCFNAQNIQQTMTEIFKGLQHALETDGRFLKGEMGEYLVRRNETINGISNTKKYNTMKLIEIQRHFFTLKNEPSKVWFCTEAETDSNLNVKVVHYIRASKSLTLPENWATTRTMALRSDELRNIRIIDDGLGMPYLPASKITKMDTQVPDSMGEDTHKALQKLIKATGGDVTDFVCERLNWSRDEIQERLLAEQVDSVALAIYNMEARKQAIIIGDQTGIGKGRMAACFIRYAYVRGEKAIFITEKANLFTDIYRDLKDIGSGNLKPLIINNNTESRIIDQETEEVLFKHPKDEEAFKRILASERIPNEYDYVLATYSQFQNKKFVDKINFLQKASQTSMLILDEAHNAGGTSSATNRGGDTVVKGSNTFQAFSVAVKNARNIVFLSATFAKRPDNMPIFALRTCISEAELKDTELIKSISQGGEALQEIISSELVHEGQMIRRERTYDGIKVNYMYMDKNGEKEFGVPDLEKEHRELSDNITELLRKIIDFEKAYIAPIIDGMKDDLADEGGEANANNKDLGVSRAPYFSKVFNVVNQVLFSIKADAVAEHAIRRLKEGKKVLIACASTFESMYEEFKKDEVVNTDYSMSLLRGLDSLFRYTEKDNKGKGVTKIIELDQLGEDGIYAYNALKHEIKETTTGVTCSPIDYITRKINNAGFVCSEVTGRKMCIEFANEKGTRGIVRNLKKDNKNVAFSKFQNNKIDALIINTSGATGASAHATNKGTTLKREEVKPRVMIIAQYELNVSTEVQKRGRINRTGQFVEILPSYDYLISAIPAEKRLMMMLQKKLKSLDANTASNQKNSTSVIDTDDFINKYGDECVIDYMRDNYEFTMSIDDPCGLYKDNPKPTANKEEKDRTDNAAKKVTGRVAILPAEQQEEFYSTILDNYAHKVKKLVDTGEYDLEVENMPLNAELISESVIVPSTVGNSVFADSAYMGIYECDVLRKPYDKQMVQSLLSKATKNGNAQEQAEALANKYKAYVQKALDEKLSDIENNREIDLSAMKNGIKYKKQVENGEKTWEEIRYEIKQKYAKKISSEEEKARNSKAKGNMIAYFYAGRACLIDGNTSAVCLGTSVGKNGKMTPSNITIAFALCNSIRRMECNLAERDFKDLTNIKYYCDSITVDRYTTQEYLDNSIIENWDEKCKNATADREKRKIVTGNILKGFSKVREEKGEIKAKLITFTMKDGSLKKGILLPQDKDDNGTQSKIVATLKKYKFIRVKEILRKLYEEAKANDYGFDFYFTSNGLAFKFLKWRYHDYITLRIELDRNLANKAEYKKIKNDPIWLDWDGSYYGRGFNGRNFESKNFYIDSDYTVIDMIAEHFPQFFLELTPDQAEQYFGESAEQKADRNSEWKPLTVDKNKIPKSKSKPQADTSDRERRLRLAKAKAKAIKIKLMLSKSKV